MEHVRLLSSRLRRRCRVPVVEPPPGRRRALRELQEAVGDYSAETLTSPPVRSGHRAECLALFRTAQAASGGAVVLLQRLLGRHPSNPRRRDPADSGPSNCSDLRQGPRSAGHAARRQGPSGRPVVPFGSVSGNTLGLARCDREPPSAGARGAHRARSLTGGSAHRWRATSTRRSGASLNTVTVDR